MELASLAAIPGVIQAAVADESGCVIACAGGSEPPSTVILVLAHATLSAANELGHRGGGGECADIIQQHANGVIYLRSLPERRLLLARCQSIEAIPALRAACQHLAGSDAAVEAKPAAPVLDLYSALHAEPAW